MNRNVKVGLIIVLLAATGLVILLRASVRNRTRQTTAVSVKPGLIKTARPQRRDFELNVSWFGRVQSKQKTTITALQPATIISVNVEDESPVKKGDVLFTLGGPLIETGLAAAKQNLESLQQRLALAQRSVSRKQRAVKAKISSLDELDAAKAALFRVGSELAAAQQRLRLLQESACIKAPVGGVFTRRSVCAGQAVEKSAVLAEIIVPERLRIVATVFSAEGICLKGRSVTCNIPTGETISAKIAAVLPERTAAGGTVVWIEGREIDQRLKPGQSAGGNLAAAVHGGALALPVGAAIYDENEIPYVFVKNGEEYKKKRVKTGLTSGGWVEILSGLTQADEVVTEGAYELYYRDFSKAYKAAD